jgi:hypothetical protein
VCSSDLLLNERLNQFCHTLIADAIRWTDGPLDEIQKKALIQIMHLLTEPIVSTTVFSKIRKLLLDGHFNVSPPVNPEDSK